MKNLSKTSKSMSQHGITGFELQKIALHNLQHWGLKPQTKTVLWVLIDCYNPENGSVVFPSMEYIAKIGAMGLTSAKEGIKELINKGLIIKSKRNKVSGNYNKYLLTPKVQISTSEQSENKLLEQSDFDRFMITNKKGINKKQTTKQNVVVSFKNSSFKKSVTLEDIPQIIKNKKHIDDYCAYWASLSEEVKKSYWDAQKKLEKKEKQRIAIIEKQKEIEKKEKEKEQEEATKSLTEIYSYDDACRIIKEIAKNNKPFAYRGFPKLLASTFNINIDLLLNE